MIASDDELKRFYAELGAVSSADTADAGGLPAYPSVDFTRERVIVREGVASEGIHWAVASEGTCVLGLLGCGSEATPPSCVVNVIAVPALVTTVETRKCDPVNCTGLQAPPPPMKVQSRSVIGAECTPHPPQ
ncbi:MAG: hypothetical protein KF764_12095 [Labilithrix sp.]|nr:hypothetical protein [Labilithrix sp.]